MTEGMKHDNGKPRWELLPWEEVEETVRVLTLGAKEKYKDFDWQHVKPRSKYIGALMRHLAARFCGERLDPEDGHPHLAHAACNLLFLMWFDNNPPEEEK
jgi:hypothetical protein